MDERKGREAGTASAMTGINLIEAMVDAAAPVLYGQKH
jgi:hypothetical protein